MEGKLCTTMRGKRDRLIEEATRGHVKCIGILMKRRKHDKKYVSKAVMAAVRRREVASVETLARSGADVNAPCGRTTPVKEAVNEGYYNVLKELVKAGADVNQAFSVGETLLKRAVGKGYHRTVKVLLESGADVNQAFSGGETLLKRAVGKGYHRTVEVLLESGADVNQTFTNGATPLKTAVDKGYRETTKVLLESRIDLKWENIWYLLSSTRNRLNVLNVLLDGGLDINTRSRHGSTLLMIVAEECNLSCILSLLKRNCDVNIMDSDGFNALMNHIGCATTVRRTIVKLLFAAGEQIVPDAWKSSSERSIKTPRCVEKYKRDIGLRAACRETVRRHLMDINPRGNLFGRTARLGLPTLLRDFLLYNVQLECKDCIKTAMVIRKIASSPPKPVEISHMPLIDA